MLSLCNIYAPNHSSWTTGILTRAKQLPYRQSRTDYSDRGWGWNCTLSKNDKMGGKPWKATDYRNLVLTTMDILDLVDIQRERQPKLGKYTYSQIKGSKSKIQNRLFLVAKNLTQFVQKSEIYPSTAPDRKAIYISSSLSDETPRGRGLWKFNNSLLNNEHYVNNIGEIYFQPCSYYSK